MTFPAGTVTSSHRLASSLSSFFEHAENNGTAANKSDYKTTDVELSIEALTVNQLVQFAFTQDKLHFFDPLTGDSLSRR